MDAMKAGRRSHRGWRALLLAVFLGTSGMPAAQAAGLSVTPVSVQFAPQDVAQGLWLSNSGKETLRAQVRVFAWSQDREQDHLEPSTALIVSPPMLSVEPGQRQFVRLVRPAPASADREQSYRLLIDELPDPAAPPRPGLTFVMRYSVPVFVGAPPAGTPATQAMPTWNLHRDEAQSRWLLATRNPGPHRLQLTDLELLAADGTVLHRHPGLLGYVLAGGERDWPLPIAKLAGPLNPVEVRVRLNGESVRQPIVGAAR